MTPPVEEVNDLITDLKYGNGDIRASAATSLGEIGDFKAVDPLIEALNDENENVRWAAAYALGEIGDSRAVDPLIETLKDENEGCRNGAAYALGEIGDSKAVDPLIEALNDKEPLVRWRATESLGDIGNPRAVGPLIEALNDENEDVRFRAAVSLLKLKKWEYLNLVTLKLKELIRDERPAKRNTAISVLQEISALGEIGKDPVVVEQLVYLATRDECKTIRKWALEAMEANTPPTKMLNKNDKQQDQITGWRTKISNWLKR